MPERAEVRVDWSREEVEACVASYLRMLTLELNGQHYSKTEHANRLMKLLDGRNRPSVELKHCNISAVMIALGYPYIRGYKPRGNFQGLLAEVVAAQAANNSALQAAAQAAAQQPAVATPPTDTLSHWVPAPKPMRLQQKEQAPYQPRFVAGKRDYLAQEAHNRSLGAAGEELVLKLEVLRLHEAGKKRLADKVEQVSRSKGDGLGYDIHSYETDGRDRLIEVKTTSFGELTPFFVTRTELARSERDAELFRLCRVFDFRKRPRVFELPGRIADHCQLDPQSYLARLAG